VDLKAAKPGRTCRLTGRLASTEWLSFSSTPDTMTVYPVSGSLISGGYNEKRPATLIAADGETVPAADQANGETSGGIRWVAQVSLLRPGFFPVT
jgi:hypothetical protein